MDMHPGASLPRPPRQQQNLSQRVLTDYGFPLTTYHPKASKSSTDTMVPHPVSSIHETMVAKDAHQSQNPTASSDLAIIPGNNLPVTQPQPTMDAGLDTVGSKPDQKQHKPPGAKAQVTRDPLSLHAGSNPEPSKGKKRHSSNHGDRAQKVPKTEPAHNTDENDQDEDGVEPRTWRPNFPLAKLDQGGPAIIIPGSGHPQDDWLLKNGFHLLNGC